MALTTDPNDPGLDEIQKEGPDKGQHKVYLVLSDEERAKGFVRPVRRSYLHVVCGVETTMGPKICETYARDPKFYAGTFCIQCHRHFPLTDKDGKPQFHWTEDGAPVGS